MTDPTTPPARVTPIQADIKAARAAQVDLLICGVNGDKEAWRRVEERFAAHRLAALSEREQAVRETLEPYRSQDESGSPESAGNVGWEWITGLAEKERKSDAVLLEIHSTPLTGGGRVITLYRGTRLLACATIFRDPMNFAVLVRWQATPATKAEDHPVAGEEEAERYLASRFEWAAPGDQQEDAWLVRFCDKDCGEAVFTGPDAEREAWEHWNRYAPSFNIYVFRLARLAALARPAPDALAERVSTLFAAIQHGDDDHRAWLREAIDAHFVGAPVPEPRGKGRKESALAEMRELSEKATAGPWEYDGQPDGHYPDDGRTLGIRYVNIDGNDDGRAHDYGFTLFELADSPNPVEDAAFIVAAVNYVRSLLATEGR